MYVRSARLLLPGTYFAVILHSDTDFCCMYTRSFRIMLSDTNVVILFRSDKDFWLNVHTFC